MFSASRKKVFFIAISFEVKAQRSIYVFHL